MPACPLSNKLLLDFSNNNEFGPFVKINLGLHIGDKDMMACFDMASFDDMSKQIGIIIVQKVLIMNIIQVITFTISRNYN